MKKLLAAACVLVLLVSCKSALKQQDIYGFRGVSRPSMEWWRPEWGFEEINKNSFRIMRSWGVNIVRLPLNQRYWLDNTHYRRTVEAVVGWCQEFGMAVVLDLHWSEGGDPIGPADDVRQHEMPDKRSLEFWREIAQTYGNNMNIWFELYNEPHNVSPEVWAYGGPVEVSDFVAVGMQDLVDTIRETGAKNYIVISGLDWSFDHRNLPSLEGSNLIYGVHIYGNSDHRDEEHEWQEAFGHLLDQGKPVIITEFGYVDEVAYHPEFYQKVIDFAEKHSIPWISWAYYPDGPGFPSLVEDWHGNPTSVGEVVRANLLRLNK